MTTKKIQDSAVVESSYKKSRDLLTSLLHEQGFTASLEETANYKRVWSRDGVIAGLASLLTEDEQLIEGFKTTLQTLAKHQNHTGRIPSNISLDEKQVSYGTTVGRVDATLWFVIGVCLYSKKRNDADFFDTHRESLEKALFYLECLEMNGRGLLYVPEGGDWSDEYINHAYVLFDQILYYIAMELYAGETRERRTEERANYLKQLIHINYFPLEENEGSSFVYHKALFKNALRSFRPPLPLTCFSVHSAYNYIANFDNALLLMTDILDTEAKEAIMQEIFSQNESSEFPILPAFSPVIKEGDPDWYRLTRNYLYKFKNKPYHFHNGGLWPLVHGFFLAGSAPYDNNEQRLSYFASALARDAFLFPEYFEGQNFTAEGTKSLGFSAAAYIIAYECIMNNKTLF